MIGIGGGDMRFPDIAENRCFTVLKNGIVFLTIIKALIEFD
jgi:hypothetical protein